MVARYSRASPATACGGASLSAARSIPRSSTSLSAVVSGSPGGDAPGQAPWASAAPAPSAAQTRCTVDLEQPTRRAVSVTPSWGNIETIDLRSESVSFLTLPIGAPPFIVELGKLGPCEKKRRNALGRAVRGAGRGTPHPSPAARGQAAEVDGPRTVRVGDGGPDRPLGRAGYRQRLARAARRRRAAGALRVGGLRRRPVPAPLVADPVGGRDVARVDGRAALGHGHDLVDLEAHRVPSGQRVVDRAAAQPARPSLRLEPRADLAAGVAVRVARPRGQLTSPLALARARARALPRPLAREPRVGCALPAHPAVQLPEHPAREAVAYAANHRAPLAIATATAWSMACAISVSWEDAMRPSSRMVIGCRPRFMARKKPHAMRRAASWVSRLNSGLHDSASPLDVFALFREFPVPQAR